MKYLTNKTAQAIYFARRRSRDGGRPTVLAPGATTGDIDNPALYVIAGDSDNFERHLKRYVRNRELEISDKPPKKKAPKRKPVTTSKPVSTFKDTPEE